MFARSSGATGATAETVPSRESLPNTEAAGQPDLSTVLFPGTSQYDSMVSRLIGGTITYEQFCKQVEESRG